jgi:hypothetical protein
LTAAPGPAVRFETKDSKAGYAVCKVAAPVKRDTFTFSVSRAPAEGRTGAPSSCAATATNRLYPELSRMRFRAIAQPTVWQGVAKLRKQLESSPMKLGNLRMMKTWSQTLRSIRSEIGRGTEPVV